MDYVAVREAHEEAIGTMANAFGERLGEKAKAMHFQRLVGALVTLAWNAGRFYSDKVTEARALTAKLQNDDRDEDSEGVGFQSKAQRAHRFAAEMGLRPAPSCRRRKAPSTPTRPSPARDVETLCRAGQQPEAQPAGCGRRAGGLRRVTKRGSLRAPPPCPAAHSANNRRLPSQDRIQVATSSALVIQPVIARGPARWEFRGI